MIRFRIKPFGEVSSTNTLAQKYVTEGAEEGLVLVAEYQTEGRGKPGRKWESPRDKNLLCSIILRPAIPINQAPIFTQIACRTVASVLKAKYGIDSTLKKPNDILVHGKKICGVLVETTSSGKRLEAVIIGIGLNVNSEGSELFPGSTSMKETLAASIDRKELLGRILTQFQTDIAGIYPETGKI